MSTTMTRQEAEALAANTGHPKDTRPKLRDMFPQSRGAFAAQVSKEDVIAILCGELDVDVAIKAWADAQAQMANAPTPAEGQHEVAAPSGKALSNEDLAVEKAVNILKLVDPASADMLLKVQERSKLASKTVKMIKASDKIDYDGGNVTINGVTAPVILDPSDPLMAYVPKGDPNYMLDSWRSIRKIGAKKFECDASDLLKLLLEDETINLVGPPGTGKTSVITQLCHLMRWPMTRFQGKKDVTTDDFVGSIGASNGTTSFNPGPLAIAYVEGHVFIVDERDHMPSECSSAIHSVMEPGGCLTITASTSNSGKFSQVLKRHPNFRMIATNNTLGFGDDSGLHPGAAVQDYALLSRDSVCLHVDYMEPKSEVGLLVKAYGIDADTAEKMVKVATDSRKAVAERSLMYPITPRQTMGWARLVARGFAVPMAFVITCINKLPENHTAPMMEMAQRHFGGTVGF